jgi:hypothetical protein
MSGFCYNQGTVDLQPSSMTPNTSLPPTGSTADVAAALPYGIYGVPGEPMYCENFVSGAADMVAHVYSKLGGAALNIELTPANVYAAYEEAVLEFSYIMNMHQAENVLSDMLGGTTGSFDQDGNLLSGELSSSLGGSHVNLKYPKFGFAYARRVAGGLATEAQIGGLDTEYSASIPMSPKQQDYDLQEIIANKPEFASLVGNKRILITKVFFKTPRAAWRFYGYYGGLTTVGNFHNYGQWADDSSFEVIPVWHNKLQAIQYENAIYTRLSHWSYELKNNKIRIYPTPHETLGPDNLWVRFQIPRDAWVEDDDKQTGIDGINNLATLPFPNIPYKNISSMGKHWIRRFALELCKETLGQIRSKFATIPIPGESVTLNGPALIQEARTEKELLRTELTDKLDKLTYSSLMASDADLVDNVDRIQQKIPMVITMG